MTIVNPAASVSFFRPEFDDFLYASIGAEGNEMPVSVLSALARLDVDPWQEAFELSELPASSAAQRLASLISRLPGGGWVQTDSQSIARRLIGLLPHSSGARVQVAQAVRGVPAMTNSRMVGILLCAVLGIAALILIASSQ